MTKKAKPEQRDDSGDSINDGGSQINSRESRHSRRSDRELNEAWSLPTPSRSSTYQKGSEGQSHELSLPSPYSASAPQSPAAISYGVPPSPLHSSPRHSSGSRLVRGTSQPEPAHHPSPGVSLPTVPAPSPRGPTTDARRLRPSVPAAAAEVTIPAGLLPRSVPRPLRAVEVFGRPPRREHISAAAEALFTRWMDAYNFGTAADGEYRIVDVGDVQSSSSSNHSSENHELYEGGGSVCALESPGAGERQREPRQGSPQPQADCGSPADAESGETCMDHAGYFVVSGQRSDKTGTDDRDDSDTDLFATAWQASRKVAAVEVRSPSPSTFPLTSASAWDWRSTATPHSLPTPRDSEAASRPWTPGLATGEGLPPEAEEELYPMPSHSSDDGDAAPVTVSLAKPSGQAMMPYIQDGIDGSSDASDNDSRLLVAVAQLPGTLDSVSSSSNNLTFAPHGGKRELGWEAADDDDSDGDAGEGRYGFVGHYALKEDSGAPPAGPSATAPRPQQTAALPPHSTTPPDSPLLETARAGRHDGTAPRDDRAAPLQFKRRGHSAAVLGAQRVLTLLLLSPPAPQAEVTEDGVEVTLPASGDSQAPPRTLTVDEAVVMAPGPRPLAGATLLREIAWQMVEGHCCALLTSVAGGCGAVGSTMVETTIGLLLAAMVRRSNRVQETRVARGLPRNTDDAYFKLEVSVALVHKGRYTKDLIESPEEELGALAPTQAIANPMLSCWCDRMMLQSVRSPTQIKPLLEPVRRWLAKTPAEAERAREVVCVYVALRQAENLLGSEEDRKLTMSSLLIYLTRSEDGVAGVLRDRASGTPLQRSLLRRVGDGAFTVVASCLSADAPRAADFAAVCAEAATLPNCNYVTGNAKHYIEGLREVIDAERAELAQPRRDGDAQARERQQQRHNVRCDLLRRMLSLLRDPVNCATPFYPDRIAAREEEEAKGTAAAAAGARKGSFTSSSSLASGGSGGGIRLQGILSAVHSIPVVTVPAALEMFSDGRVHTVAMRSSRRLCGFELMEGTTNGLRRMEDLATFYVDEIRDRRIMPRIHTLPISRHTSALCTLFSNGYNTGVLSFDGRSKNLFASPAWFVLAESIDKALSRPDVAHRDVRMALTAVSGTGEALDLTTPGAAFVPLRVASSPLFGAAVHTSAMRPQTSPNDLRRQLAAASVVASPVWNSNVFLHVLLVNYARTRDGDAVVCSLSMSVFGSHASLCERVLASTADQGAAQRDQPGPLHPEVARLLHGVLSGSAASVFLTCIDNADDGTAALNMAAKGVAALSKTPSRSGNVREFVDSTRAGLERRRRRAASLPASEQAHQAKMQRRISEMLDDHAALLAPHATTAFPKAYLTETVAAPPPEENRVGPGAVDAAAPASDRPAQWQRTPQPPQQPQPLRRRPSSHAGATPASLGAAAQRKTTPANAASPSAEVGATGGSGVAVPAVLSHPRWVLGLELSGSSVQSVQAVRDELEWAPTQERFETDGIVFYNTAQPDVTDLFTQKCEAMQSLLASARASHSCAILGLTDRRSGGQTGPIRTLPMWRSFSALVVNSAFQGDTAGLTWRDGSELHFRMSAIQDRTIIRDFLLGDGGGEGDAASAAAAAAAAAALPARVALAANPLFGPVVRNTTVMRAVSLPECRYILRSGLDAIDEVFDTYPSGTVIVASVVLKNVTADDVLFSSITAFGVRVSKDLPALRDMLALDPKGGAPPSLYQYSLRGPCHLLCLTTLDSAVRAQCVEALRLSQTVRYGVTPAVPRGSLRTCLQEQEEVLQQGTTQEPARTNTEHVVRQLRKMLSVPAAPIVIFPFDDDGSVAPLRSPHDEEEGPPPAAPQTPRGTPTAAGTAGATCRCIAVLTGTRGSVSTVQGLTDSNAVRMGTATFRFSEVALRADHSSVLRPSFLSSVVQHVQQGRNVSLIVADGGGSSVGAALLSKLVGLLIGNSTGAGGGAVTTLFMSIAAVRFPTAAAAAGGAATAKDLFNPDAEFHPLRVARSPLFGPCVDGARFSALNRLGDVYLTMKDAQKACSFLKATLVMSIVLKQVLKGPDGSVQDLLMSSVFAAVQTAEMCTTGPACAVFDRVLDLRDAALAAPAPSGPAAVAWRGCLLANAFGGESFTYGVVGLRSAADEAEAAAMLRFGSRLMAVPSRVPPKASARDMLARARRATRSGGDSTSGTDGARPPSGDPWRSDLLEEEAMALLSSPDTCQPRAFSYT